MAFVVIMGGHFGSVSASIRYGFLAVSFSKREISGELFGFVEGSIVFGYIAGFLCRPYWDKITAKVTPKMVLASALGLQGITAAISGLADLTDNNSIFIALSIFARVFCGFTAFPHNVCCMDMLKNLFPRKFDFVMGLMQMGYYSGHGVGEFTGTALYDKFGYRVPFIYSATGLFFITACSFIFLPSCPSIAAGDEVNNKKEEGLDGKSTPSTTALVFFPVFACMLINCVYAYLQIASTPYLYEKFGIPLSIGGTVLVTVSIGIAIGSSLSGTIAQTGLVNTYTQMAVGALVVGLGLLLMFPSPSLHFLYNNVPYIAYPAVLMSGIGDPMVAIPALRAMTDLQTMVHGECTGKNEISIFGFWMLGTACSAYSGALVGGALIQLLSYQNAAYLLVIICCISSIISLVTKIGVKWYQKRLFDEERIPILSEHKRY